MVGANTFREPSLTAKMATTLDHISDGRAILGIGGAWFETEHDAFGLAFGDGFPERLRWLGEALPIMRGMLHGERADRGRPALLDQGRPQPSAAHPGAAAAAHRRWRRAGHAEARGPLRRRQQRRAAGIANVRRKEAILLQHCETVGRDPAEIERTTGLGTVIIRDSRAEAERVQREIFAAHGNAELWMDQPVGTVEDIAERLAPFVELGYRHLDRRVSRRRTTRNR